MGFPVFHTPCHNALNHHMLLPRLSQYLSIVFTAPARDPEPSVSPVESIIARKLTSENIIQLHASGALSPLNASTSPTAAINLFLFPLSQIQAAPESSMQPNISRGIQHNCQIVMMVRSVRSCWNVSDFEWYVDG
jgi:hypothetical protein